MNKFILILILILTVAGCTVVTRKTSVPQQQTQLQTREFQTRLFDTNDTKLVMKAVLNVLQDDGFVVKNAVVELGLLSATKEIEISGSSKSQKDDFWGTFFENLMNPKNKSKNNDVTFNKFKLVEVSVNVTEYGKQTKVRANFQAKILDNKGNPVDVYSVDDAKFYQDFFAKVDKGVFLQKQGL